MITASAPGRLAPSRSQALSMRIIAPAGVQGMNARPASPIDSRPTLIG